MSLPEINFEIERFEHLIDRLPASYKVDRVCSFAYGIHPQSSKTNMPDGEKSFLLSLMAITHGNEIAGMRVLNRFLDLLVAKVIDLPFSIGLALGNYDAAKKGVRFVDKDMNRSFGCQSHSAKDAFRAKELEVFLAETQNFIDFHQTIEQTLSPFWIFPYTAKNFSFMSSLDVKIPIVTHWGQSFSKEGMCTDEFVNRCGGAALSIELGQKGFSVVQETLGLYTILQAIKTLSLQNTVQMEGAGKASSSPEIYTWGEVIPFLSNSATLDKGWYNFRRVEKGERLGHSEEGEILAGISGPVLFPKYGIYDAENRPTELCRILRKVDIDELGKG